MGFTFFFNFLLTFYLQTYLFPKKISLRPKTGTKAELPRYHPDSAAGYGRAFSAG